MSKLYIVPTPIGNLEDITLRAIRVLKESDLILAEDTRVTKKLLNSLEISKPILSFHTHNEHKILSGVIDKILSNNSTVLVSDAGTPGISDPGFLLIRECILKSIKVECLPGPVALIPAIVSSGFSCDRFVFEGFLPHKKGRKKRLEEIGAENKTSILYESPHRLVKCLNQIVEFMGEDRKVCVARELTKLYEEFKRGTAKEIKEYYEKNPPKGEAVIIIEGKDKK
ncbi:MAG: 16S rRNA (cytidine(1402)-2'-O)-methyltransferase [Crocinitomicaceae bacterium]|nr:16S rRNA (cytidine(1402)-2'-O)-methyltransferase [Crocinitomicaceae bacterium]|tara:strand:+ start:30867 stop:31544 length:678 start_codon:yes stop_codon:yes gene_type:complete